MLNGTVHTANQIKKVFNMKLLIERWWLHIFQSYCSYHRNKHHDINLTSKPSLIGAFYQWQTVISLGQLKTNTILARKSLKEASLIVLKQVTDKDPKIH